MKEISGETSQKKWFVKSQWLEENKVAYIEMIGDFGEDGITKLNEHWSKDYLDVGTPPVHTILDVKGLTDYPRQIKAIRDGSSSAKHPQIGWVLIVGMNNPVVKFLTIAVSQILGVRSKVVESVEEAKDVLRRIDRTISELA